MTSQDDYKDEVAGLKSDLPVPVGRKDQGSQAILTGRIQDVPHDLLDKEILLPQFFYELQNLLPYYVLIEQAMLTEYVRLELLSKEAAEEVARHLAGVNQSVIQADATSNMSDICFALERYVEQRMEQQIPAWHADRSRNDVQATAQVMFAREQILSVLAELYRFTDEVHRQAISTLDIPMPGYTHYQSAQIITPGFYLSAINEQMGKIIKRLLALYDDLNECPLGSGAMAGLELKWDREGLATLLGFRGPSRNALSGVASKEWAIAIAAELSNCSVQLGRFATDLIIWGSSEYRFIDLPDYLSGISSAMPQKKNFPILERIRGRSSHISAYYMDLILGQHNTPFTNLVETAKEGGRNFAVMTESMRSVFRLFTTVMINLTFNRERTQELCAREFFGGFTLANLLTFIKGIPYRKAQIIAGRYIVQMLENHRLPEQVDLSVLETLCAMHGHQVDLVEEEIKQAFDVKYNLENKSTQGSTNPSATAELLAWQARERTELYHQFKRKEQALQDTYRRVEMLALGREL